MVKGTPLLPKNQLNRSPDKIFFLGKTPALQICRLEIEAPVSDSRLHGEPHQCTNLPSSECESAGKRSSTVGWTPRTHFSASQAEPISHCLEVFAAVCLVNQLAPCPGQNPASITQRPPEHEHRTHTQLLTALFPHTQSQQLQRKVVINPAAFSSLFHLPSALALPPPPTHSNIVCLPHIQPSHSLHLFLLQQQSLLLHHSILDYHDLTVEFNFDRVTLHLSDTFNKL